MIYSRPCFVLVAVPALALSSCDAQPPVGSLADQVAICHREAEQRYPRSEKDNSIYHTLGPAAEYAETCMQIAGYGYGGPQARRECFEEPGIGSKFKTACYWAR